MPLDETNGEYLTHFDTSLAFFETESEAVEHANRILRKLRADKYDGWGCEAEGLFIAKILKRAKVVDGAAHYSAADYELGNAVLRPESIGDCPMCNGSGCTGRDHGGEVIECRYCDTGEITRSIVQSTRDQLDSFVGDEMYRKHLLADVAKSFRRFRELQAENQYDTFALEDLLLAIEQLVEDHGSKS